MLYTAPPTWTMLPWMTSKSAPEPPSKAIISAYMGFTHASAACTSSACTVACVTWQRACASPPWRQHLPCVLAVHDAGRHIAVEGRQDPLPRGQEGRVDLQHPHTQPETLSLLFVPCQQRVYSHKNKR